MNLYLFKYILLCNRITIHHKELCGDFITFSLLLPWNHIPSPLWTLKIKTIAMPSWAHLKQSCGSSDQLLKMICSNNHVIILCFFLSEKQPFLLKLSNEYKWRKKLFQRLIPYSFNESPPNGVDYSHVRCWGEGMDRIDSIKLHSWEAHHFQGSPLSLWDGLLCLSLVTRSI